MKYSQCINELEAGRNNPVFNKAVTEVKKCHVCKEEFNASKMRSYKVKKTVRYKCRSCVSKSCEAFKNKGDIKRMIDKNIATISEKQREIESYNDLKSKIINKISADNERAYEKNRNQLDRCIWRRKHDAIYAIKARIRSAISGSIRRKGYTKQSRTHEILGCDYDFFIKHLESTFTDGMSWDVRDQLHIDHIIPLASAKTEEDVLRLNHYTNLQMLWAEDNLKKSSTIPVIAVLID